MACDLDFVVLALAIHLRVDAKASCARENLQGFFKPLVFVVGKIAKMRQPETFLDDYSEEVIALWANLNYSPQLRRGEARRHSIRLDKKCITNFWHTTGRKDGADNIGDRIPQRIFLLGVSVIEAYLPIVASCTVLAADWQHVAVRDNFDETVHSCPRFRLEEDVGSDFSQECFDAIFAVL